MQFNYYRKSKVISSKEALKQHSNRENLVFVSGCFDVIHLGHLFFLRGAKELVGDKGVLLVAVHDDKSITKHKGSSRPINNLNSRIDHLSELICTDFIMPWFGWDNIQNFVKNFRPGKIAVTKGQFENKTIINLANELKIQVEVIRYEHNISSSELINKLIGQH